MDGWLTEDEQDELDDFEGLVEDHPRKLLIHGPEKPELRFNAQVSFALPAPMLAAVSVRARQAGMSRSAFLREAVLARLEEGGG